MRSFLFLTAGYCVCLGRFSPFRSFLTLLRSAATHPPPARGSTTNYIGEFVFNGSVLDYIFHEEGRVVYESNLPVYEFNVRDHLGNVRQVLRTPSSQIYMATMEDSNASAEEQNFTMMAESRQSGVEHNVTVGGNKVAWLNSARGRTLGPSSTLPLAAGDSIRLKVFAKYEALEAGKFNKGSFIATAAKDRLIKDLLEFSNVAYRTGGANSLTVMNIIDILAKDLQNRDAPEAYMGYALYDADSNLYEVGKHILSKNAANKHETLENNLYIPQDGYMETFLVNETDENVWFDDFSIMSTGSPVIQETHYDPWGLELTGIGFQASGMKVNKYLYNGKELIDDLNLNFYDYGARMYDPAIGRWGVVDPMAHLREWVSPYNFVQNNPINRVDPTGALDHEYDVDIKTGEVKKVSDKGGEDTHYYNIIDTDRGGNRTKLAEYSLNTNEFGLVPFPESGPNWGRYGSRDAGGDNWASPETAGAFFGLLYDWAKDPLTDMVYFDDISGKRGQDIGHSTHRTGDDIDIRYFGAGQGANLNSLSADCSTCWNTISNRGGHAGDVLYYSTYNFLRTADKWGFNQNYAYPKGFPYTKDKAHFIHRHHLHIGRR